MTTLYRDVSSFQLTRAPLLRRLIFCLFPKRSISIQAGQFFLVNVRVVIIGDRMFLYDSLVMTLNGNPNLSVSLMEKEGNA